MTEITLNPLRWDWPRLALPHLPSPTPMPHISDHIARDAGIDGAELATLRHVWPSQSKDRPLI